MPRKRIKFAIVSTANCGNAVIYRETKQQVELGIRRAEFEKSYSKNSVIFKHIEKTPNLVSFSNNIQAQIAEFKQKKEVQSNCIPKLISGQFL